MNYCVPAVNGRFDIDLDILRTLIHNAICDLEEGYIMNYTTVKVPTITMEELTKLQNDYLYFEKMYNKIEKMKKKTRLMQWFCKNEMQRTYGCFNDDV